MLQRIIEYADNHSGAVMAVLTLVYVFSSILMTLAMFMANSLSNKAILSSLKLEKERKRPYVIFDIELHDFLLYYVVKNIGLTSASVIKLSISPIPIQTNAPFPSFMSQTIHSLAPGRKLESFLDSAFTFFHKNEIQIFDISINYKDYDGVEYFESDRISLEAINNIIPIQNKWKHHEEIARNIKMTKEEISRLNRTIETMREKS